MLRIWLALGIIALASCAPITLPGSSGMNSSQSKVGSIQPPSQPETHFNANAKIDDAKSTALTNYLHGAQLPLVGARVLASSGGPRQAILYGYVGTPFGKADAVDKAREWLNDSDAQVDNRITIEPDLVKPSGGAGTATANNDLNNNDDLNNLNNPEIQKYQEQLSREQASQQQQYMNQGAPYGGGTGMTMGFGGGSPFSMFLPLLMGGGMGFGGGGFGSPSGSYGSPYSSPYSSPYGSSPYPSYPSSGGSPYGP